MNIFYTDHNPKQAALWLDDKRIHKMLVESCQMLSTACHKYGLWNTEMYKPCYHSHPSTLWVCESGLHYLWLCLHAEAMASVVKPSHKSIPVLRTLRPLWGKLSVNEIFKVPPSCNPFKDKESDVVKSYRTTMVDKWENLDVNKPKWTLGVRPYWYL